MDEQKKVLTEQETKKILGGTGQNGVSTQCTKCGYSFVRNDDGIQKCPHCGSFGPFRDM